MVDEWVRCGTSPFYRLDPTLLKSGDHFTAINPIDISMIGTTWYKRRNPKSVVKFKRLLDMPPGISADLEAWLDRVKDAYRTASEKGDPNWQAPLLEFLDSNPGYKAHILDLVGTILIRSASQYVHRASIEVPEDDQDAILNALDQFGAELCA